MKIKMPRAAYILTGPLGFEPETWLDEESARKRAAENTMTRMSETTGKPMLMSCPLLVTVRKLG